MRDEDKLIDWGFTRRDQWILLALIVIGTLIVGFMYWRFAQPESRADAQTASHYYHHDDRMMMIIQWE